MTAPVARTRDLVVRFGEQVVLDGVSIDFHADETTCVIGGSGTGKSVLLKSILGLVEPTEGCTELLGEDVNALESEERAALLSRVGMLFQHGALFGSMNVAENVALPLRQHTRLPAQLIERMVEMRLAQVGLPEAMYKRPAELSGGMQRRVAMARASILDPDVLICDEPSSGLDPVVAAGIDDLLSRFSDELGMTIIVITHELASVERIADRILMVGDQQIIADGTFAELSDADDERVRRFFRRRPPDDARGGARLLEALRA